MTTSLRRSLRTPAILACVALLRLAVSAGPGTLPGGPLSLAGDLQALGSVGWPVSAALLVAEVVTGGASASDEYVELTNAGSVPADLAGLELVYVTSSGGTVTRKVSWTTSTRIDPGRHLLIANASGIWASVADATSAIQAVDEGRRAIRLTRSASEMKIGIVTPYAYPMPGGVNDHVGSLYRVLRARGHDVRIITSSHGLQKASEGDIIRVGKGFSVPFNGSMGTITLSPTYLQQMRQILERERFDVLHYHEPFVPFLSLVTLTLSTSVNIGTFHAFGGLSISYEFGKRMLGHYAHKLHGRIAVSPAARHFISRYFPGEYKIVPNGVEPGRYQRAVPIARYRDGVPNILFVGRMEPRKGLIHLLRAFRKIQRDGQRVGAVPPRAAGAARPHHPAGREQRDIAMTERPLVAEQEVTRPRTQREAGDRADRARRVTARARIACVQRIGTEVGQQFPVPFIRTTLRNCVDHATQGAAELGFVRGRS